MTDPKDIGRFTDDSIGPILLRAQKLFEASGHKTQLMLPHGDQVKQGTDVYAVDIGQILYLIPSENFIKIEFVPETDEIFVSTQENPMGTRFPFDDKISSALTSEVDNFVQGVLRN